MRETRKKIGLKGACWPCRKQSPITTQEKYIKENVQALRIFLHVSIHLKRCTYKMMMGGELPLQPTRTSSCPGSFSRIRNKEKRNAPSAQTVLCRGRGADGQQQQSRGEIIGSPYQHRQMRFHPLVRNRRQVPDPGSVDLSPCRRHPCPRLLRHSS
jgi:hypothetical protein